MYVSPIIKPDMGMIYSLQGLYRQHPRYRSIAHWIVNEGGGNILFDVSGNKRLLSLINGPLWTVGQFGSALSFDGINDRGSLTPAFNLARYTWSMRVKGTAAPSTSQADQIIINGNTTDSFGFSWHHTASTFLQAAYQADSGGVYTPVKLTSSLQANVWYHITTTYDGTNLRIYLNGNLEATAASNAPRTPVGNFFLGGSNLGGGNNQFSGLVDDICIRNWALSEKEISSIYHQPYLPFQWASEQVRRTYFFMPEVAGVSIPSFMHSYRRLRV